MGMGPLKQGFVFTKYYLFFLKYVVVILIFLFKILFSPRIKILSFKLVNCDILVWLKFYCQKYKAI